MTCTLASLVRAFFIGIGVMVFAICVYMGTRP